MSVLRTFYHILVILIFLFIASIIMVFIRYGLVDFILWIATLTAFYAIGHAQGVARVKKAHQPYRYCRVIKTESVGTHEHY